MATLFGMPGAAKPAPGAVEKAVLSSLREAMDSRQLQQTEVAARVGFSASQLSRVLSGKRPATFGEMLSMAAVLGVDLPELLRQAQDTLSLPGPVPASAEADDLILEADLAAEERERQGRDRR